MTEQTDPLVGNRVWESGQVRGGEGMRLTGNHWQFQRLDTGMDRYPFEYIVQVRGRDGQLLARKRLITSKEPKVAYASIAARIMTQAPLDAELYD